MDTTMGNKTHTNSKVAGAVALLISLSACGQGFKAQYSQELSADDSQFTYYARGSSPERTPATLNPNAASTSNSKTPVPVAANDNDPVKFRFISLEPKTQAKVLERYKHIDPKHEINTKLLREALLFYFVNQKNFTNKKVMTVIDYSLPSSQKRLYVIDMNNGRVWSTYVAHGRGSDKNHDGLPEVFTNKVNSNATSLGPFLTMGSYKGENGLSLRLKGLSKSNSNALERNVVIHGASYVRDAALKQGRSFGCPAVASKYTAKLINAIKGGSLVFAGASKPSIHRQL